MQITKNLTDQQIEKATKAQLVRGLYRGYFAVLADSRMKLPKARLVAEAKEMRDRLASR